MIRKLVAAFVTILFAASLHSTALAFESGEVLRQTGHGFPPSNWNQRDSFAKTFARQAARMDALRKLAEIVGGLYAESNPNGYWVRITLIQDSKAFKLLEKNARVVDVKFLDGGGCEVDMEVVFPTDWKP